MVEENDAKGTFEFYPLTSKVLDANSREPKEHEKRTLTDGMFCNVTIRDMKLTPSGKGMHISGNLVSGNNDVIGDVNIDIPISFGVLSDVMDKRIGKLAEFREQLKNMR